jgi:hypothetical protein
VMTFCWRRFCTLPRWHRYHMVREVHTKDRAKLSLIVESPLR